MANRYKQPKPVRGSWMLAPMRLLLSPWKRRAAAASTRDSVRGRIERYAAGSPEAARKGI